MGISLGAKVSAGGGRPLGRLRPLVSQIGCPAVLAHAIEGPTRSERCPMQPILQSCLPHTPWMDPRMARLPGTLPLEGDAWLVQDDAFAAQMALRDRLIAEIPDVVLGQLPQGVAAAEELYDLILARLATTPGYVLTDATATRPDGVVVPLDRAQPLKTLGRLVQEDLCLMQAEGAEHHLTGACLCFPASWSLSEKLGRPLIGIHRMVKVYEEDLARRVQRMFDMIRVGQPLWRMNALVYVNPDLHQPGFENAPRTERRNGEYVRSERQTLLRMPQTGAVVFAIHTYVVRLDSLTPEVRAGLEGARL